MRSVYKRCVLLLVVMLSATVAQAKDFAQQQVAGYYHFALGKLQVTALYDGYTQLDAKIFHGIDQAQIQALLNAHFVDPAAGIQTSVNAYLVNTGKQLILIDSGAQQCFGATLGSIEKNLQAAGYQTEQIDAVLLTHLHPDHACGITSSEGKKVFSNATVYVSQAEADFWLNAKNLERIPAQRRGFFAGTFELVGKILKPYQDSGQFKRFVAGEQLFPELRSVASHGHTVGHSGFMLESQQQKMMIIGDVVHNHRLQFSHPEISFAYDYDATQAIAARQITFTQAAQQGYWVAGAHLPFPGIGQVQQLASGEFAWLPVVFSPLVLPEIEQ